MRRLLLTLLSSLSLLLSLATLVFWIRSHHLTDHLSWRNAHGSRVIYTAQGHLMLDLFFTDWSNCPDQYQPLKYRPDISLPPMNYIPILNFDPGDIDTTFQHAGFYWWERRNPRTNRHLIITGAPFWSIAAVTALLPLIWMTLRLRSRLARRKLQRKGLCQTCAYDLRATPPGHPCPECGASSDPVRSYS
jgi:hypothetical protein